MILSGSLLKDNVTVISKAIVNGEEVATTEEVTNVRVEAPRGVRAVQGIDGLKVARLIIWVDLKKSVYSSIDIFNEGNTVEFKGTDYNISDVFPAPQRNGEISHLEVSLV